MKSQFLKIIFLIFLCLLLEKFNNKKYFSVNKKFSLILRKSIFLGGILHFLKVIKKI
jgi:hypothetical protein